jgi:hypothetical protein
MDQISTNTAIQSPEYHDTRSQVALFMSICCKQIAHKITTDHSCAAAAFFYLHLSGQDCPEYHDRTNHSSAASAILIIICCDSKQMAQNVAIEQSDSLISSDFYEYLLHGDRLKYHDEEETTCSLQQQFS